jgi:hypothetical protein
MFCPLILSILALACFAGDSDSSQYLPLKVGKKWVLRSRAVGMPMVFEVIEKTADGYRVRWDNPWIPSELVIVPKGEKIYLSGLTMNGQSAPMPEGTLYWDFNAAKGAGWANKIGKMVVMARDNTVRTNDKTYTDVIEIRENNQLWSFAPGVGFVQFGEGESAFVLDQSVSNLAGTTTKSANAAPRSIEPAARPSRSASSRIGGRPLIGLQATIFANEALTPATAHAHFQQSVDAGITFLGLSATWAKLEPRPGEYRFNEIDFNIAEAASANIPVAYTLSIIDTGMKTVPDWLKNSGWQDPKMQQELMSLIEAMVPHFKGRLSWVMIGNEIDPYFEKRGDEAAAYATLLGAAAGKFHTLLPGVQVSHTITFHGLSMENGVLKPLFDKSDFLSLTYYPASGDFRFRDPDTAFTDFRAMIAAARGKKILLQEVGYSSSPLNDSSQDRQAKFFENVFSQLQAYSSDFIGANFLFMSDFSDSVVDGLVRYYHAPGAERFRAFLQTLGMFDGQGNPKKSWAIFQQEATNMKR